VTKTKDDKLAALTAGIGARGGQQGNQRLAEAAGAAQARIDVVLGVARARIGGLSPAEQLAQCAQMIRAAEEQRDETMRAARERTTARFYDTAGPYLMWVRDNELNRLVDLTFEQWALSALGYKSTHTYTIMDAVEVRAGLGIAGTTEFQVKGVTLNTGHVRAIIPAMRAKGAEIAPQMWSQTLEREGKVTESALRETWRIMASETSEESNGSFESVGSVELEAERRHVNAVLDAAAKQLDSLVSRLADLADAGVAPLDQAAAEKAVARIKTAGRWLRSDRVRIPLDTIVDAELVDG
jgi:hypothetical protein